MGSPVQVLISIGVRLSVAIHTRAGCSPSICMSMRHA